MDPELRAKVSIYQHFASVGRRPSVGEVSARTGIPAAEMRSIFARLRDRRVLALEADGETIRMAPPFSGVPTQHRVAADGVTYYANCAWDAFGIPAALGKPATVHSRCEQSLEPLELEIGRDGPNHSRELSEWRFHCLVPAANWWDDIVFT